MNSEQIKSGIRWLLATGGGFLLALAVNKNLVTADQAHSIINSEFVVGILTAGASVIWSFVAKTMPNLVSMVDKLPVVEGVILKSDEEGKKIADAVPSITVVPAGTAAAKSIAS